MVTPFLQIISPSSSCSYDSSMIPNTACFSNLSSGIRHIWPKRFSFFSIIFWTISRVTLILVITSRINWWMNHTEFNLFRRRQMYNQWLKRGLKTLIGRQQDTTHTSMSVKRLLNTTTTTLHTDRQTDTIRHTQTDTHTGFYQVVRR